MDGGGDDGLQVNWPDEWWRRRDKKRMIAGIEPGTFALEALPSFKLLLCNSLSGTSAPRHLPMFFLRVLLGEGYLKADAQFTKDSEASILHD